MQTEPEPVLARVKNGQYTFKAAPVDPLKFRANYWLKFLQASQAT